MKISFPRFNNRYATVTMICMSVQVGKIKTIPIRLHFTLIIVFFLLTWTLASRLMPELYPGLSISSYWLMGAVGAIILFASVLLHELAHSLVALWYGLRVRQITLFIFGGVSEIDEEESSKDFRKEFNIAIVGPVTSFVISALLAVVWLGLLSLVNEGNGGDSYLSLPNTDNSSDETLNIIVGILYYGAFINLLLGVFNLIPAFPLDGGRVLRAALLKWRKDYDQATKIASKIGIAISYGIMGLGFIILLGGSFISGIWLLFIGWFLNSGAQSYLAQHELTNLLSNVRLGNIMNTTVIAVTPDTPIDKMIHEYFNIYSKDSFPVVDSGNHLIGMITFKDAWNVPVSKRNTVRAKDIMINKSNIIIMNHDNTADVALMQMARKHMSKVFICDKDGRLIALVSKTDIMNAASERKEFTEAIRKLGRDKRGMESN